MRPEIGLWCVWGALHPLSPSESIPKTIGTALNRFTTISLVDPFVLCACKSECVKGYMGTGRRYNGTVLEFGTLGLGDLI